MSLKTPNFKRFNCQGCGGIDLVAGGTSGHRCATCRSAGGVDPLSTPQYLAHKAVAQARRAGLLPPPAPSHALTAAALPLTMTTATMPRHSRLRLFAVGAIFGEAPQPSAPPTRRGPE